MARRWDWPPGPTLPETPPPARQLPETPPPARQRLVTPLQRRLEKVMGTGKP
jgi:hypothetical protein